MNDTIDLTTLIFLIIAVVIFLRLRSVLGRRTGNERPPIDPYAAPETKNGASPGAADDNVVSLPQRGQMDPQQNENATWEDMIARIRKFAPEGGLLEKGLMAIAKADARFDPEQFISGAKTAYEMIVMAFAEGNRRLLKQLLSREVYEGFDGAIADREKMKRVVDSSFVGINRADIVDAELKNKTAHVTVKFVSSLITATIGADGQVIEGDPKKVREVTDIWTFAREVSSRDPNWKLVATEAVN